MQNKIYTRNRSRRFYQQSKYSLSIISYFKFKRTIEENLSSLMLSSYHYVNVGIISCFILYSLFGVYLSEVFDL